MVDGSRDLKVAAAHMQEVQDGISEVEREVNVKIAARDADRIQAVDWVLAMKRIDSAEAAGIDVSEARAQAYFTSGTLSLAVLQRFHGCGGGNNPSYEAEIEQWTKRTIDALNMSVQIRPMPEAWFILALAWTIAGNKQYAIQCFQNAEAADDEAVSIKASKMIDRLL